MSSVVATLTPAKMGARMRRVAQCCVVCATCGIITLLTLVQTLSGADIFGISPYEMFVKGYGWTILTASLVERSFPNYLSTVYGLLSLGLFVEPVFGIQKTAEYILVTAVASNLILMVTTMMWWRLTDNPLAGNSACGGVSLVGAMAVVIKQLNPETHFRFPPFIGTTTIRGANIPHLLVGSLLLWNFVFALMYRRWGTIVFEPLKMLLGILVGWVYLRFYQRRDGRKGDSSDVFAFVTFFPDNAQPTVGRWLGKLEEKRLLLREKLGLPSPRLARHVYNETPLTDADKTRHRNLGLELLEQQMSITTTHTPASDTVDDLPTVTTHTQETGPPPPVSAVNPMDTKEASVENSANLV